ncbi:MULTISPECIES: nuclear transport factor 2 family protein [unclassified Pedobacter]|uniref:nuclear transport factor 2 family protein n=1 Tax=unclassified Pedobacter TaxID=2628915 RepID=UPI001E3C1258|nr:MULTISPECIES: nuclear transport factor 2 family protein [unclassified Pedobacter]
MSNKELVLEAVTAVFSNRNIDAIDQYFSNNYIQHNPFMPNGTEGLKQLIPTLPPDFNYEPATIAESGDIVMVHGRFANWFGKNYIAVDIFKVKDGKLVEHWDVMQEEVPAEKSVSGNAMFPIV